MEVRMSPLVLLLICVVASAIEGDETTPASTNCTLHEFEASRPGTLRNISESGAQKNCSGSLDDSQVEGEVEREDTIEEEEEKDVDETTKRNEENEDERKAEEGEKDLEELTTTSSALDLSTDLSPTIDATIPTTDTATSTTSTIPTTSSSIHYSTILVPAILIVGLFGNTMTVIVMSSDLFRKTTMSGILIALSCSDTALIIMSPLNKTWFKQIFNVDPRSLSTISCKSFFWAWRTAKMTSSWLVVLISIERFIAVYFPLKVKTINTKRNATIGILLVYLLIGGFNGGWVVVADTIVNGACVANYPTEPRFAQLCASLVAVGTSIYCFIPAAVITVFNCAIIAKLVHVYQAKSELADMRQTSARQKPSKTSIMLLTLCISFIVLVIPVGLAHNIAKLLNVDAFRSTNLGFAVYFEVAQTLEQINYSINFFLYVSSSAKFRAQAKKILCGGAKTPGPTTTSFMTKGSASPPSCSRSQPVETDADNAI